MVRAVGVVGVVEGAGVDSHVPTWTVAVNLCVVVPDVPCTPPVDDVEGCEDEED